MALYGGFESGEEQPLAVARASTLRMQTKLVLKNVEIFLELKFTGGGSSRSEGKAGW